MVWGNGLRFGGKFLKSGLRARNKMPLSYRWLQAPLTASSIKEGLNVPQGARLSACLVCIRVSAAFAQLRLEIHFVMLSKLL